MPAKKGQKFKHYSKELKMKAIQMKVEGVPHREIMRELNIHDEGRLKIWMRKLTHIAD